MDAPSPGPEALVLNVQAFRIKLELNLEVLVFEERGKPEKPEKNLGEQRRHMMPSHSLINLLVAKFSN